MKKLLISLALTASTFAAVAQNATPIHRELSLLTGWNLFITNGTAYGPGQLTNLYTLKNGQIVYGLTNQVVNGTVISNGITPDAFNVNGVSLLPDALGDINANAAVHYYLNNTNWIPIAVTNSQGQYFVLTQPTNGLPFQSQVPPNYTGWPLAVNTGPVWMFPATTNYYLLLPTTASSDSPITFYIQRGWRYSLGASTGVTVWDSATNSFQFTVVPTGLPQAGATNLPTAFTQGANMFRCSAVSMVTGTNCAILNALSIGQPQ